MLGSWALPLDAFSTMDASLSFSFTLACAKRPGEVGETEL
jgi:hypothetical protein